MKNIYLTLMSWAYGSAKYVTKGEKDNEELLYMTKKSGIGLLFLMTFIFYGIFSAFYTKYLGLQWSKNVITYGISALCAFMAYTINKNVTKDLSIEILENLTAGKELSDLRAKWLSLGLLLFIAVFVFLVIAIKK
jgi:hypothetical protein